MYAPPHYRVDDIDRISSLIQAHPFATLVANGASGPIVAYLPLALEYGGGHGLIGHLARANPFSEAADGGGVVAIFAGPDAYIPPSYYPSKQAHGKVVPTWNYVRVEARGRLAIERSPEKLRHYIDAPTTLMEQGREAAWSADDAPSDFITKLSHAIVGVRIEVASLAGSWKLDQSKSEPDRAGAIAGLRAEGKERVADLMDEIASD